MPDELFIGFIEESLDALESAPAALREFRTAPGDHADALNAVFRTVHTIKGNASFFGLVGVKQFAHRLENALDAVRQEQVALSEPLERLLVDGLDRLRALLDASHEGAGSEASDLDERQQSFLDELQAAVEAARPDAGCPQQGMLSLATEMSDSGFPEAIGWAKRLRELAGVDETAAPSTAEPRPGQPAQSAAEQLREGVAAFAEARFSIGDVDVTEAVASVLRIFEALAAGPLSDALAEKFAPTVTDWLATPRLDPADQGRLQEALENYNTLHDSPLDFDAELAALVWEPLAACFARWRPTEPEANPVAESPPSSSTAAAPGPAPSPPSSPPSSPADSARGRLLRIKEESVDAFLGGVAELFITGERLKDLHGRLAADDAAACFADEFRQINAAFYEQAARLEKNVVALRRVPAKNLLAKLPSMARGLASNMGKRLEVHLDGGETEIDKQLVNDLDGPLTHIIRNVADHALELPEERIAAGKPETGNLWIKVEAQRNRVVLSVRDDGRGIDPQKVLAKALDRGLITSQRAARMSDQEVCELIFAPGFSTSATISEVSGRGVGLDVVQSMLKEHAGQVAVDSEIGRGTEFRFTIPVKQAVLVIDALVVEQDGRRYALPFEHLREIISLTAADLQWAGGQPMAIVRDEPVAAASLGTILDGTTAPRFDGEQPLTGIVVGARGQRICLLVEKVAGQRKVVVNSLSSLMTGRSVVAGVTQLGAGRLALVLSGPDLVQRTAPLATDSRSA